MPSPFPGLDPYLEGSGTWLDVHTSFLACLRNNLNASLGGRYIARLGDRVIVEMPEEEPQTRYPDVYVSKSRGRSRATAVAEHDVPVRIRMELHQHVERYVMIMDPKGTKVVTVIELLSPTNKTPGPGGRQYAEKQGEVLESDTHLVEIDLLRGGDWTLAVPQALVRRSTGFDCLVSVSRAHDRGEFEVYPILLERRLPRIAIPLLRGDSDVVADLQSAHDGCYDGGGYRESLDYSRDPEPPVAKKRLPWLRSVLRKAGLRRRR